METEVGESEKRDIQGHVARILRDLGNPEPPLRLDDVRHLLSLDLAYYSSQDPGLIAEFTHRFKLFAKKTLPDAGRHLADALRLSRLCAFWVPDTKRIMIDEVVPQPKHRWIEAHEIAHSITPWHKTFLLGDNDQTLDPACRAILESEANYGAGQLLFLQDRFVHQARDLPLRFKSVQTLASTFSNSLVSTLWRLVEDCRPDLPVFALVSKHPKYESIGRHDGPDAWRYFVRSHQFSLAFGAVSPSEVYGVVGRHATMRRAGPVLTATDTFSDATGVQWEFLIESFSTTHALLTLGTAIAPRPVSVSVGQLGLGA